MRINEKKMTKKIIQNIFKNYKSCFDIYTEWKEK